MPAEAVHVGAGTDRNDLTRVLIEIFDNAVAGPFGQHEDHLARVKDHLLRQPCMLHLPAAQVVHSEPGCSERLCDSQVGEAGMYESWPLDNDVRANLQHTSRVGKCCRRRSIRRDSVRIVDGCQSQLRLRRRRPGEYRAAKSRRARQQHPTSGHPQSLRPLPATPVRPCWRTGDGLARRMFAYRADRRKQLRPACVASPCQ